MSVLKAGLRSAAISIENETVSVAYNGTFVKWPPSSKLTLVGFFVPGGHQRGGDWSTSALVRDLDWSLPVGRGDPASAVYSGCWTPKGEAEMPDRDHDQAMATVFKADPTYAAALLSSVEADGDLEELAIVRRQMQLASMTPPGAAPDKTKL